MEEVREEETRLKFGGTGKMYSGKTQRINENEEGKAVRLEAGECGK